MAYENRWRDDDWGRYGGEYGGQGSYGGAYGDPRSGYGYGGTFGHDARGGYGAGYAGDTRGGYGPGGYYGGDFRGGYIPSFVPGFGGVPFGGYWGSSLPGGYGYGYGYGADYGRQPYGRDTRGEGRGFMDRASDEVASWFGDEEAERRRRMDAQRQGQLQGRGPKSYTRSDERIHEDVCDRLSDDPFVDASEIEVTVSGREVTLSGTVDSREQRRRAEDCAEEVSGVTHVQNNIRVRSRMSGTAETNDSTAVINR